MSNRAAISVILPTYNESGNIALLIDRLKTVLKSIPHEIIVVDDNSPDRTWEIVEKISEKNPWVRVIRRIEDRGLSSAVLTGMAVANGEVFAVMDADLQHDESILPEMFRAIHDDRMDICIGSRGIEGGSYGNWSATRRFMSWVAAFMAKVMLPVNVKDPMSGFFVISRETYQKSADKINPRGFKILLEFIGRSRGLAIKEIGYTFKNRIHGETKLSSSVIKNYLIALWDLRFGKYVTPTFLMYCLVGASGVLVYSLVLAACRVLVLQDFFSGLLLRMDPNSFSMLAAVETSIISNYFLNNYFTFYERRHSGKKKIAGFVKFQLVSLLGLIVQIGVFQMLQANGFLIGILSEGFRNIFNNALGIVVATVSNYYLNLNFTWRKN